MLATNIAINKRSSWNIMPTKPPTEFEILEVLELINVMMLISASTTKICRTKLPSKHLV